MQLNVVIYNACDLISTSMFSPTLSHDRDEPIPLAQPETCPQRRGLYALAHQTDAETATEGVDPIVTVSDAQM